jgi:hypothetical protein
MLAKLRQQRAAGAASPSAAAAAAASATAADGGGTVTVPLLRSCSSLCVHVYRSDGVSVYMVE